MDKHKNVGTAGNPWTHYGTLLRKMVKMTGIKQHARYTHFFCKEESRGFLVLSILHKDSCWLCLDIQFTSAVTVNSMAKRLRNWKQPKQTNQTRKQLIGSTSSSCDLCFLPFTTPQWQYLPILSSSPSSSVSLCLSWGHPQGWWLHILLITPQWCRQHHLFITVHLLDFKTLTTNL